MHATMVNTFYGDEEFINELDSALSLNINAVRYPLYIFNAKALSNEQYLSVLAGLLIEFDRRLAFIAERNMKVFLVLGSPPGGDDGLKFPVRQYCMIAAWQVIAARYADNDTVIGFELLNEPDDAKTWNQVTPMITGAIRSITDKTVIIGHVREDLKYMKNLKPVAFANVLYAFHFYLPRNIVFQGIRERARKRYKGSVAAMMRKLSPALKFARKYNVPVVNTEFGCSNRGVAGNQARWIADAQAAFQAYGIGWTYNGVSHLPFDVWAPR